MGLTVAINAAIRALMVAALSLPVDDLMGQSGGFIFDGVGLGSDFAIVAGRFPNSVPQSGYIALSAADIHDHVSAIELSGTGAARRVRVAFETRPDGAQPDYPACAEVEAGLVRRYGTPEEIHRFSEEASARADRIWRSATEVLTLICFRMPRGPWLAEAVQITPR